jgi:hypothetical protein
MEMFMLLCYIKSVLVGFFHTNKDDGIITFRHLKNSNLNFLRTSYSLSKLSRLKIEKEFFEEPEYQEIFRSPLKIAKDEICKSNAKLKWYD